MNEQQWAEEGREHIEGIVERWGLAEDFARDTRLVAEPFQLLASSADLTDTDQRSMLHSDLAGYLAEHLIRSFGAKWLRSEDQYGTLWLVQLGERTVDPFELAHLELTHPPVHIVRMLAEGERALGATAQAEG